MDKIEASLLKEMKDNGHVVHRMTKEQYDGFLLLLRGFDMQKLYQDSSARDPKAVAMHSVFRTLCNDPDYKIVLDLYDGAWATASIPACHASHAYFKEALLAVREMCRG